MNTYEKKARCKQYLEGLISCKETTSLQLLLEDFGLAPLELLSTIEGYENAIEGFGQRNIYKELYNLNKEFRRWQVKQMLSRKNISMVFAFGTAIHKDGSSSFHYSKDNLEAIYIFSLDDLEAELVKLEEQEKK